MKKRTLLAQVALIPLLVGVSLLGAVVWTTEVVDSIIPAGAYVIETDAENNPHILYTRGGEALDLIHAFRDGSSWQYEVVDTCGGIYLSLALDQSGEPHAVYSDCVDNTVLKYASRMGGSWSTEVVDNGVLFRGHHYILDLDSRGYPHIVYNEDRYRIKYAFFYGTAWRYSLVVETLPNEDLYDPSLAIDEFDQPHIAYCHENNGDVMNMEILYQYWDRTQWVTETVDGGDWTVSGCDDVSIRLDRQGVLHLSYQSTTYWPEEDYENFVRYARRDGMGWTVQTIDPIHDGSYHPHLDLDRWDNPHVVYAGDDDYGPLPRVLGYAWSDGAGWEIRYLVESLIAGARPHAAIDGMDEVHIVYRDSPYLIYGRLSPDVRLTLLPDTSTVLPGDTLTFTATLENNRNLYISGDLWIEARLPNENEVLVPEAFLDQPNPNPVSLDPYGVLDLDYFLAIPDRAPLGDYRVIGNVGLFPSDLTVDRDFFEATVSSP